MLCIIVVRCVTSTDPHRVEGHVTNSSLFRRHWLSCAFDFQVPCELNIKRLKPCALALKCWGELSSAIPLCWRW